MKILCWTPLFWPDIGGIEMLVMKTLPVLKKRHYNFIVITSHGNSGLPDEMDYHGIPVYRFPFWEALVKRDIGRILKIQKEVTQLIQVFEADLIHFHFSGYTAYFYLNLPQEQRIPSLITLHTSLGDCEGGPNTILGKLLRRASWVTSVSQAAQTNAHKIAPEISGRSSVIYPSLPPPLMPPEPLSFEKPKILCVGRLVKEKGLDLVVSAVAMIRSLYPHLRLTLVGEGPLRASLEQQVIDLGLKGVVEFRGRVPEILTLMNQATMVVVPSLSQELFGLVALEAAQMARPVIASRVGGLPEVVADKITGLVVEAGSSKAIAEAIRFLLDHPEEAKKMGQAARERAFHTFNFEKYIDSCDELYQRLILGCVKKEVHGEREKTK